MKMNVYVMYDTISGEVVRIFYNKNDEMMMRFLKNAIEMPNSPFLINLKDMKLRRVAELNVETCEVTRSSEYVWDNVDLFDDYKNDFFAELEKIKNQNNNEVKNVKEFKR